MHIKRLVGKFKQRTDVPYPYHYKKGVAYPYHYKKGIPYQRAVLLIKIWGVPYRTAILGYRTGIHYAASLQCANCDVTDKKRDRWLQALEISSQVFSASIKRLNTVNKSCECGPLVNARGVRKITVL